MVDITRVLKSSFTLEVTGENPERFLNAAAAKGIYICAVEPIDGGLRLRLSRRAYAAMKDELPRGMEMKKIKEHGAAKFLRRLKKRFLLLSGGVLVLALTALFSQFVWMVEISGGDEGLQKEVAAFLEENNIRSGTAKRSIDQNRIKREAILSIDDLMWLWVDIKGTTAYVKIAPRNMPPEIEPKESANVVAAESGVIEKITTLRGTPAVSAGETVEKGDLLISGVIESERLDEPMLRHAQGVVQALVWREKNVLIPKKTEERSYTGNERKIRAIKIKKFIVNFSLNSSILYPKYDKIRHKYKLGNIPAEFISDTYKEVEAQIIPTDTEQEKARIFEAFEKEITDGGAQIISIEASEIDRGDYLEYSVSAECLTDIGKTVPME